MKVFINGRFLTQPVSGVQRYAAQIVRSLNDIAADSSTSFELLCPPGSPELRLPRIPQWMVGGGGGHRWEQWDFARAARGGVALSLATSGPLLHGRQLVVIHDAAVHRQPQHFSRRYTLAHRMLDYGLARRATIGTVSEFSRGELASFLGMAADRILVAPNGADHVAPAPPADVFERIQFSSRPCFLTLGNLTPNKNLAVVVRALKHLDHPDMRVIVIGAANPRVFGTHKLPDDPRLLFAGRLEDGDVRALMGGARALIFPSRYEGFGLPPLEAMASDCPVIASNIRAVREVCGAAAALFDPEDDRKLAALMMCALEDDGTWRAERIAAGRVRAARYRWDDSARIIADACRELAEA